MSTSQILQNFPRVLEPLSGEVFEWPHPERGPNGETVYTHVWLRRGDPKRLLVSLSGLHGAEVFIGSRIQQQVLQELKGWSRQQPPTLLFVHNFNAFGSAWIRRVNHQNVDLNRNSWPNKPKNPAFAKYHDWLSARNSPQFWTGLAKVLPDTVLHGTKQISDAIACGQADFPDALFFAGTKRSPEILRWQEFLQTQFPDAPERIIALDLHTGLGPWARESLIVDPGIEDDEREGLKRLFNAHVINPAREKGYYPASGSMGYLFQQIFPKARLCYLTQEFGTYSNLKVLRQLAFENWAWHHQGPRAPGRSELLSETFYPSSKPWQDETLRLGVHRFRLLHDFI